MHSLNPNQEEHKAPLTKKVLLLITKGNYGGAGEYVYTLAKALQQNPLFTTSVAVGIEGSLTEKLEKENIPIHTIPHLKRDINPKNEWLAFKEIRALLQQERPDTFHINSSKAGVLGALAGRIEKVPNIVFTAHGWAFNENRSFFEKLLFYKLHYLTILLAHKTICVSEKTKNDMDWLPGVSNKCSIIHNGIDRVFFITREKAREELNISNDFTLLGTIAELHNNKGIDVLIDAFTRLAYGYPQLRLVIIGEGEERFRLEQRALPFSNRIIFVGFKKDARRLLKAFDIFALPSRTEAFPYTLLEAGKAGLPAIASNVGGVKEIINHEETGLLIPSENEVELAIAVERLITEPDLAHTLGTALKEKVGKDFKEKDMVEQTIALY
jgi:glycosyltransferase involved in cell wall biosynthesis